jgi:predicted chitinase
MSGIDSRSRAKLPSPGPFIAEVTNLLDPTYMGSVEVALFKGIKSNIGIQADTYIVRYLSPFAGSTSVRYEGTNSSDFNDVQKSYGMWMVPPDVGTKVMVIFIDGDPNQGYWIGCVPSEFQNHMIPGIAATKQTAVTAEQRQKYGTDYLPVAELHSSSLKVDTPNIDRTAKPVHPFADRLLAQGLLIDNVRGVTSSSARREVPSGVFGISTPGPLDTSPGAKRGKIGYEGNTQAPVSRLGGSTFVMDDGDVNGQNELVRIRTRTGHQILLHNTQDLIYIANSKGTAWIEMTSAGKLDIYAQDSVSIHTEADFNFRADRDINMEAGRNINMRALQDMETNVTGHYFLVVDDNAKIAIRNSLDTTIGDTHNLTVINDLNLLTGKDAKITSAGTMSLSSEGDMKQSTGANFNVGATGNYYESAALIHMNGPAAAAADPADTAETPPMLSLFSLPNRKFEAGWANGNFFKADPISSIMQRVPTHEPWDQHENVNPRQFSSAATDASLQSRASSGVADSPATGIQDPANTPQIVPGTCDPKFAKDINNSASQAGIAAIKAAAAELGLTTPNAVASLLGIAGGECRWKLTTENFNYTAARLLQVFPSVFKGDADLAAKYAGNPNNSLPEFLYGSTTSKGKGLGNTETGDGAKFVGRGYIQLTGRANYTRYSKMLFDKKLVDSATALVDNPELLATPQVAARVSVLYMLDRCKAPQSDPGYVEKAIHSVGFCTPDIYSTKKGFYECFLAQLSGGVVGTGSGTILTTSDGTPVKTGSSLGK